MTHPSKQNFVQAGAMVAQLYEGMKKSGVNLTAGEMAVLACMYEQMWRKNEQASVSQEMIAQLFGRRVDNQPK